MLYNIFNQEDPIEILQSLPPGKTGQTFHTHTKKKKKKKKGRSIHIICKLF